MLRKLLIVPLVLVGAALVAAAFQPAEVQVTRSRAMAAPAAAVFARLQDFHAWKAWSPWEKLDPTMKKEYSGTPGQPGASYSWEGNEKVGSGRMTIESIEPPRNLAIKLEFLKPWQATNQAVFTLVPEGNGTRVTWTMTAHNDYVGKLFSLLMSMDSMVGPDFERGLEALEKVATDPSAAAAAEPPAPKG
jgi:uncharacterized protein YndB with AHSA1/START domain